MDIGETILERVGYGSSFNCIRIQGNEIEKKAISPYGLEKIKKEIQVYEEIHEKAPSFPLAKLLRKTESSLVLPYYHDYQPLWIVYKESTSMQRKQLLEKVISSLDYLHSSITIFTSRENYTEYMEEEVIHKTQQRYIEIKDILEQYAFHSVNGIPCLSFDEAIEKLKQQMKDFLAQKKSYTLCLFHGDPQFNNILYNPKTEEIVFIDPRGYFGKSPLHGIVEYDYAKVLFALSGYDYFDSTSSFQLDIQDGNITLPSFVLDNQYRNMYQEIHFLLISIWLANAHCFKNNPHKAVVSHAYARYLATIL